MKLVDGVWFGVDDQWVGQATRFTSGWGYTRYDLPDTGGLKRASAPTSRPTARARRAVRAAADQPRRRRGPSTVKVDAHSELMGAYPWGFTGLDAERERQPRPTTARSRGGALQFTDDGDAPGRAPSTTTPRSSAPTARPLAARRRRPAARYRGPQGARVCPDGDQSPRRARATTARSARARAASCATRSSVPAARLEDRVGRGRRLREGRRRDAQPRARRRARATRRGALRPRSRARDASSRAGRSSSLPGDRAAAALDRLGQAEPRRPHPGARRDLQIRWTNQGKQFPAPLGHRRRARAGSAPASRTTRGSSPPTASTRPSPAVALGQFETVEDHLRTLRDISDVLNDRLRHRRPRDGRGRLDLLRPRLADTTAADGTKTQRLQHRRDDQVPERRGADLALDRRRRASATRCTTSRSATCRRSTSASTSTSDGWPEGSGNVERAGHGSGEARQRRLLHPLPATTSPTWRARSATAPRRRGRPRIAAKLAARSSRRTWWIAEDQPVRGLAASTRATRRSTRSTGSAQVPMEAELDARRRGRRPAWPPATTATTALAGRENSCFSGDRPGSLGLFHTGCGGGHGRQGRLRDLLADDLHPGRRRGQLRPPRRRAAAALHGRQRGDAVLRAGDRRHARRAARRDAGDLPVGAERRRRPRASRRTSTAAGPAARCSCRRGATTAPRGRSSTSSSACGPTSAAACSRSCRRCPAASRAWRARTSASARGLGRRSSPRTSAATYTTRRRRSARRSRSSRSGTRCRAGATVATVMLDGRPVTHYDARETNRGLEVTVATGAGHPHAGGHGRLARRARRAEPAAAH